MIPIYSSVNCRFVEKPKDHLHEILEDDRIEWTNEFLRLFPNTLNYDDIKKNETDFDRGHPVLRFHYCSLDSSSDQIFVAFENAPCCDAAIQDCRPVYGDCLIPIIGQPATKTNVIRWRENFLNSNFADLFDSDCNDHDGFTGYFNVEKSIHEIYRDAGADCKGIRYCFGYNHKNNRARLMLILVGIDNTGRVIGPYRENSNM